MLAYIARRLCVGAVISSALLCNSASAVLIRSGNGNTTAPADDPGFANVGKSSSGNASVTYLGNRWVITAGHVSTGSTVSFDPDQNGIFTTFNIDASTIVNPIGTADLQMFRLTTDPGLPALNLPPSSGSPAVDDELVLIGNGLDRGASQRYWNVTGPPLTPTWTEVTSSDTNNRSGFSAVGGHTIRWGKNAPNLINLIDTGFNYFTTKFDDQTYTGLVPFVDEAQATNGDSGGGVFQKIGSDWILVGIIFGADALANQPADTAVFINTTAVVNLAEYRTQILALVAVPEPSSIGLAVLGAAGLLVIARRLRRA